jgi:hypothetical protein
MKITLGRSVKYELNKIPVRALTGVRARTSDTFRSGVWTVQDRLLRLLRIRGQCLDHIYERMGV